MIFKKKHNTKLYNKLLFLSRNFFFYKDLSFSDTFETRIYLMFMHYSIILIILKQKKHEIDQINYDNLFFCIENNLRELGYGDIAVNKKMKELNKIFYDILLKISKKDIDFKLNKNFIMKYFDILRKNDENLIKFELYFKQFHKFCFEKPPENVLEEIDNYIY